MKWQFKKFLIKALLGILTLYTAINIYQTVVKPEQPIKIIKPNQQVAESKYMISEEAIMSKLRSKSQIVSLEQQLDKKDTYVDENFFGKRATELKIHGKYLMGLNTKDISISYIDNQNGIVYMKLPVPILINLDIPFDKISFDKTQGFLRMAMDEKEEKVFYKAVKNNIKKELMNDKELLKQANIHNKDVIMSIMKLIPEVKSVVFQ